MIISILTPSGRQDTRRRLGLKRWLLLAGILSWGCSGGDGGMTGPGSDDDEPVAADWTLSVETSPSVSAGGSIVTVEARLADGTGQGVPGIPVAFTVAAGSGSISATAATGQDGVAQAGWTLPSTEGGHSGTASIDWSGPERFFRAQVAFEATVVAPEPQARWADIRMGVGSTCAVRDDGRGYCWGADQSAQLGNGTLAGDQSVPTPVAGGHRWRTIRPGTYHSCGLTQSSDVYCWGTSGSLVGTGESSGTVYSSPTLILGGGGWESLDVSQNGSCAVRRDDHAAFCWGTDPGLLGGFVPGGFPTPTLVGGGLEWRNLDVGHNKVCGITLARSLYCWPELAVDGPALIDNANEWNHVSSERFFVCAVTTGGGGYCWGSNSRGELGVGDQSARDLPTPVAGDREWRAIIAGWEASCGLTADEQIYCSGWIGFAQQNIFLVPELLPGNLQWSSVAAGAGSGCGIDVQERAWCWGRNQEGQLGIGDQPSGGLDWGPKRVLDPTEG